MTYPGGDPIPQQVHQERTLSTTTGMDQDAQRGMRGKLIESIMQLVVQAITGVFVPGPLGTAFTQLSGWAQSLGQSILGPLVNVLVTVLDSIPIIGPPLGDALEDLANLFGIMKTNTTVAQATGETAQITADSALAISALNTAAINSTGGKITDTFDRSVATDLGSSWDQNYANGGGYLSVNGANDAAWANSGGGSNWCLARNVTALTTGTMSSSVVVATNIDSYSTGDNPEVWILLRSNAAKTELVIATIGADWAEIGCNVGGVYTRFGTRFSLSGVTTTAGLWECLAGTVADDYEFVLMQGGNEIMRRSDGSHVSKKDASHQYVGFGIYTGTTVAFFAYKQGFPPNIQAYTAIDRTATA